MPKTPAHELPIIRSFSPDFKTIRYHLQDKRKQLPQIDKIDVKGLKVKVVLKDGTTRHLPDLNKGYSLVGFDKWEIKFIKVA